MIYQWKPGSRKPGHPQAVGEALETLRVRAGGRLSPRDVVVEARNEASILHAHFEWRDNVAAQKYRERQAGELICAVVAIHEDRPDVELPAFVAVGRGDAEFGPYQAVHVALANEEDREYVLQKALKELKAWRKRYHDLQELSKWVPAVDAVIEEIEHDTTVSVEPIAA